MSENGVVPQIATLVAREHGDAQKAVDTFYEVGRLVEKAGDNRVIEDYVDDALKKIEVNRFQKLVSG